MVFVVSGYMSASIIVTVTCDCVPDPQTKEWLVRNLDPVFGFPGIVRFSWATCAQLLDQRAVDFEWLVLSATTCVNKHLYVCVLYKLSFH